MYLRNVVDGKPLQLQSFGADAKYTFREKYFTPIEWLMLLM